MVAFPVLAQGDRERLEAFRRVHDPQAARIGAHLTLVFPAEVASGVVVEEAARVAKEARSFEFSLTEARIVADSMEGGHHLFLVPGEGSPQLVELHDRLYAGSLQEYLRADLEFVPHVTVGKRESSDACQGMRETVQEILPIRGEIDTLHVVEVTDVVREVRALAMGRLA